MLGWKKSTLTSILIAATIFAFVAFILSIVSISLQRWQSYDVRPEINGTDLRYYSRYRGMFWECLKEDQSHTPLPNILKTEQCRHLDMGGLDPNGMDNNYWQIIRLRRAQAAMLIIGILCVFGALVATIMALGMTYDNVYNSSGWHKVAIRVAGSLLLLTILCFLATLFIFHVLMDEEKYRKSQLLPECIVNWPPYVQERTLIRYASSYYLLWSAVAFTALAALPLLALFCWDLDHLFNKRTVRTVEERTVITGGPYGQPTIISGETVHVTTGYSAVPSKNPSY
jgi:phosphate/sulfate permease